MLEYTYNGLSIKKYTWDVVDSNSYLITYGTDGLLIDAIDSIILYQDIRKLDSLSIILTHSHFDHVCGLNSIRKLSPETTVISTKKCSENLGNIYRNMSSSATAYLSFYQGGRKRNVEVAPFVCAPSTETFEDNRCFRWHDLNLKLQSCHGHSNDGLLVLVDDLLLFSGDTLLSVPTITRFVGGNTTRFWEEDMPFMKSLSGRIDSVFPGHGNTGKMKDMIACNQRK